VTTSIEAGSLTAELQVAADAARAAGAAAMRFYGPAASALNAAASPVTAADHAANDVIVAALREAFPADAILSEESADSPDRLAASRVWIVDPLDGTKEFLAQNGEFSIMIGLAVRGEAALGVVYRPDGDVLYDAARGAGAWVERGGRRSRLECQATPSAATMNPPPKQQAATNMALRGPTSSSHLPAKAAASPRNTMAMLNIHPSVGRSQSPGADWVTPIRRVMGLLKTEKA